MKNMKNKRKGISLIVLVITILVMIILAGVVVVSLQKNNPIEKAKEATFKQSLAQIGEELEMFCVNEKAQNSEFNKESLHASKNNLAFNTKTESSGKNIYDVIPSLKDSKYKNQVEVIQGMLFYRTPDKKEIPWLKELGIHYTGIVTGTVIIEGDTLVGVSPDYVNTGTLVIPNTVKKINPGAFSGCEDLNAVVLPEGITEIPNDCFSYCTSLASISLPSTITRIGENSFRGCSELVDIVIPKETTIIDEFAFYNCLKLSNVTFNDKLKVIEKYAFSVTNLQKLELKEGLERIGELAFQRIKAKQVILPNSLLNIESAAFIESSIEVLKVGPNTIIGNNIIRLCNNLKTFEVHKDNPYHTTDNNSLYNKDKTRFIFASPNVTNIVLPSSVKYINNSAFIECKSLVNVQLQEGLLEIGERCFEGCENLTTLNIPSTVNNINGRVLEFCNSLNNLTISPANTSYMVDNNVILTKDGTRVVSAANVNTSYTVPNTVTVIGEDAFARTTKLKNVTIGNKVSFIGRDAFRGTGLTNVTIPSNVETIDWGAFRYSNSITKVTFEEGVKNLRAALFLDCHNLKTVIIPSTVSKIDGGCLSATRNLDDIQISSQNNIYKTDGRLIYSKDGKILYGGSDSQKIVTVQKGVERIASFALQYNDYNMQKLVLPDTIKVIESNIVSAANALKRVTIPSSITSIDPNAFKNTPNLSEIVIDKIEGSITGSPWGATQGMKAVIWQ